MQKRLSRCFIFILLLLGTTLLANYQFLGDVESYQLHPNGVRLECQQGIQLDIRFLLPNLVRFTLLLPGQSLDDRLTTPLYRKQWPAVALEVEEGKDRLVLLSSEVDVSIQFSPCRITILNKEGEVILEDDPGMGWGWEGNEIRSWKTIREDDRFFGLGEKTGDVNKRGREWVMWTSDIPGYDNNTDPLYQAIPFFIGLRHKKAYGVYVNNSYRTVFNMSAGNLRYFSFSVDGGIMDYFFIYGPQFSKVVQTYTEITGRTPMPPKWALGYQQCRWSYFPDREVLRVARTFRERNIPADVIYLDIHYMDDYKVFTWHPTRFPDPAGLMQQLEQMGFKTVVIVDPGVKADPNYAVAREGLENGYFLEYPDGQVYVGEVWPGPSYFPDFSYAEARGWWGRWLNRLFQVGVKGIWNDMNEPAVWGKAFPLEVLFQDEGRWKNQKKMHNLYGYLMAQATFDAFRRFRPRERPFILTRAGFAGIQRYAAVWTGDNVASFEHLALGIRMMLGMGLSGLTFIGTDVGGFIGTPSGELFARWMQIGAVSPLFRGHTHYGSVRQEPWIFGEEIERISRKFVRWRYRLFPYLYTLFWEASESGVPILRPLFWEFQEDEQAYNPAYQHQFLVGSHLMIAPVLKEGQRILKVYLPDGKWLELNSLNVYEGPGTIFIEAPLDQLPTFLREGGMLPYYPVRPYIVDQTPDSLQLSIYPAGRFGRFVLYEDDGSFRAGEDGNYRLTAFEFLRSGGKFQFNLELIASGLAEGKGPLILTFYDWKKAPRKIRLNGRKLSSSRSAANGYTYDPDTRKLIVWLERRDRPQALEIQ
ncbi:MAG: DUF4968 domain-containing protein [Calditrichaeota bacterium]|nr:DUF4968 domain-containing protein [Calditrichota bacterium]